MSIRLAFSSSAVAAWNWAELAARAAVWGYQGVEVNVTEGEVLGHPLLASAAEGRKTLEGAGLAAAGVITGLALHVKDADRWQGVRETVQRALEKAQTLGASCVGVTGWEVPRGEDRMSCMTRIGRRLAELGALAEGTGVTVVLRNGGGFVRAKDVWMVLEVANHPAVGVAWDVAATEEMPSLSVPTLNTRIRYGMVAAAELGTGEVGAKNKGLVDRLRGIGFDGWVSYSPAVRGGVAAETAAKELAAAAKVLRAWLKLPELGPDGKPVPPPPKVEAAKPAAAAPAAKAAATAAKPVEAKPVEGKPVEAKPAAAGPAAG